VVPEGDPRFAFLAGHLRIRAKRLRGVFSMGLLIHADPGMELGQEVDGLLGITRWEPKDGDMNGEDQANPGFLPRYTDIEGLRRWPKVLEVGEEVVITEKIHGANARFVHHEGKLWVFSHGRCKLDGGTSIWNRAAAKYDLANRLQAIRSIGLYGEVFGQVQDLKYGAGKSDVFLRFFDAFDLAKGKYLDYDDFLAVLRMVDLQPVPELYRGLWDPGLKELAEGPTTVPGAEGQHVREGFVVRPVKERYQHSPGRVILKLHGQGYLTRKEGKKEQQ